MVRIILRRSDKIVYSCPNVHNNNLDLVNEHTWLFYGIVMLSLSFTISKIFAIERCMTLIFRMVKVRRKYTNRNFTRFPIHGNSNIFHLSLFPRHPRSKCAWYGPRPLDLVKVKYKYANRKPIHEFILDENSNFSIYVTISVHCRNVHYIDLDLCNEPRSNMNMAIESPCATSYVRAIVMPSLFMTISTIVALEVYMTSNFTNGQNKI